MRKIVSIALVLFFAQFLNAFACNEPGTPNPVSARALDATTIEIDITNTASEGDSGHNIWFFIQDRFGHISSFTLGQTPNHHIITYPVQGLASNKEQCFEVWTRTDTPQGCRSQYPSGWVCAVTAPPYSPALVNPSNDCCESGLVCSKPAVFASTQHPALAAREAIWSAFPKIGVQTSTRRQS